jgi:hypothetical protein
MGMGMGMGMGGPMGAGYAPIGYEDLMPRADPYGIYRLYTHHADEVVLSMRDPDTSSHRDNFTVVDRATGTVIFRVKSSPYSPGDKRNIYDMSGNWLFQVRRKGLPFTNDTWIGCDPISQRTIFSLSTKHGVAGGLGITFLNTAGKGEQAVIRIGGDMVSTTGRSIRSGFNEASPPQYAPAARFTDAHGQTVARLNKDAGTMFKHLCEYAAYRHACFLTSFIYSPLGNRQHYTISVAGQVDTALIVAICVCLDDKMSRIVGLQH